MCPDENTIASYLQGTLALAEVRAVDAHIDGCGACREMMSELGRVAGAVSGTAPSAAPALLAEAGRHTHVGHKIGRYDVQGVIGHGGMGEVLLATDPVLHRRVAIKLIRRDLCGEVGAADRLVREARAMATLNHPNVVAIYDAGVHEGQVFLAMEFVAGVTLDFWLATGSHPWEVIVQRFVEAGRGLQAAHEAGILHRDFKPHNVMVGADGRARVMDFGLARATDAPLWTPAPAGLSTPPHLTVAGAVLGTPAYMSPEQLHGQPVDPRSDGFSFCVALYEALFGVRPYGGATLDELRWNMMQQRPAHGPNLRGVPSELIRVIERGLSIASHDRPPSMQALLADMNASVNDDTHVRANVFCQAFFTLCHAAVGGWFVYDVYLRKGGSSSTSSSVGTSSALSTGEGIAAGVLLVWMLVAIVFLFGGPFWALLNTVGLSYRRNWARVSTILYGAFALSSCIGIPYGIYAIWSLTRPTAKRALSR
jgi:serine/threonine-protein kinase